MKKVIWFFALFSFAVGNAFAASYYVATTGSDASPGTEGSPWATIQHAAETMVAGDTVFIRDGVYNEYIEVANSGDATSGCIVFSAYPGEKPIIDGTGNEASNGFIVSGKSHIKLLGLEIRNWDNGNALWIENCHHIEISDCEVHHAFYGIGMGFGTHDFELNRVKIHHFDLYGFDASPSGGAPCYNGVFNDCIAYTGRDPQQNVDGFALGHGDQQDFAFNRCITYDVFDGFDISSRNTTLNRCSAYNCWNGGYKLWQDNIKLVNCLGYNSETNAELDWSGTSKTVTFQNCTFVDAGTFNIWIENANDWLNMYNCIVAGGDNIGLGFEEMGVNGYSGDYNVFHNDNPARVITVGYTDEFSLDQITAGAWSTYSGEDEHSLIVTDPDTQLFRDLSAWDLHLRDGSLAIDEGRSQGAPAEDFDGNTRPLGAGVDIGAYEYIPGNPFNITGIVTDLTGPPAAGNAVQITLTISPQSNAWYWWYARSGFATQNPGAWQTLEADWSTNNSITWTPQSNNRHVVLAWIGDTTNRTNRYQAGLTFETENYSANPIQITGMTSTISFPQASGTPITLNAIATGGSGTIYYKYFAKFENGNWTELGGWDASGGATWTPSQEGLCIIVVHISEDTNVSSNPYNQAGMICLIGE